MLWTLQNHPNAPLGLSGPISLRVLLFHAGMGWSGFYCKISLRPARFEIMKKKNGASKVVLGGVIRQGSGLGVEKTLAYLGIWLIATS